MVKKEKSKESTQGTKKKKGNVMLWIALVVLLIPCVILGYILIDSRTESGEPVEGSRFKGDLEPAIKDEQLKKIEGALKLDGVESVSVNLKQATLRILINTNDDLNADQIQAIMNQAYDQVIAVLPVDTYFKNGKDKLMYDLEVHVYNLIPKEGVETAQIYYLKSKNAAAEEPLVETLTSAKNNEVANPLLHPETEPKQPVEGESE